MPNEDRSTTQEKTEVIVPISPEFNEASLDQAAGEHLIAVLDETGEEESEKTKKFFAKVASTPIQRVRIGRKENFFLALTCNGIELTERIPIRVQWDTHLRIDVTPHREMAFNGCSIFNTPIRDISKEPVKTHSFEMMNGDHSSISRIEWDFRE
jgi:hypothetical protein